MESSLFCLVILNIMNTHINFALKLYERVAKYDLDIYKELVYHFLKKNGVDSVERLAIFLDIVNKSPMMDVSKGVGCEIVDGKLQVSNKRSKIIKLKSENIDNELEQHCSVHNSTIENIVRAFIFLKEIVKRGDLKGGTIFKDSEDFFQKAKDLLENHPITRDLVRWSLISKTSLPKIKGEVIEDISVQLFSHLGKSLLNAEYLICDDYKIKLDEIAVYFRDPNEDSNREGDLYVLKSFLKICWYLQEACDVISRYLEDNAPFNLVLVNSDREKRFEREYRGMTLWGKEKCVHFESLIESIIDMTITDHCYKASEETVEKLFHLYDKIKHFNENIQNSLFREVLKEAKIKTASMLNGILNDNYHKNTEKDLKIDYGYIINSKKGKTDFLEEVLPFCIPEEQYATENGNYFLYLKKQNINKSIDIKRWEFPYNDKFKDLLKYHKVIQAGLESYCVQSEIIYQIHQYGANEDSNIDIIEKIKYFFQNKPLNLSASFFRQVLYEISEQIKKLFKNEDWNEKQLLLLSDYILLFVQVLNELYEYIKKYKSNIPRYYRPHFGHSFYSSDGEGGYCLGELNKDLINNYDIKNFENKFFFASLGCMPLNHQYLEGMYNIYRAKRREYDSAYELLHYKTVKQEIKQTTKDFENKLISISTEQSRKHIELTSIALGIFAAFIAFVTVSINLIQIAKNIQQFVLFGATFMGCILLFVIYVKHSPMFTFRRISDSENKEDIKIKEEDKRRKKEEWHIFYKHLGVGIAVCGIFFGIAYILTCPMVFHEKEWIRKNLALERDSILEINEELRQSNKLLLQKNDSLTTILWKDLANKDEFNKKRVSE